MDVLDAIVSLWEAIKWFFTDGLYELAVTVFANIIIAFIGLTKIMTQFAWDTAKQILLDLKITEAINNAWGMLDSKILAVLNYLRLPDLLNMIFSAHVTRYVLGFIPFSGYK